MRTGSCYRQETMRKKPGHASFIALAIFAAFIAGAFLGNTTHIVQDVSAASGAAKDYLLDLCRGSIARGDVPRLVEQVKNIAELYLAGMDTDIIVGP